MYYSQPSTKTGSNQFGSIFDPTFSKLYYANTVKKSDPFKITVSTKLKKAFDSMQTDKSTELKKDENDKGTYSLID